MEPTSDIYPNQLLVSVVIALYKTPISFLRDAIESAINQTWTNLEILVSDDSPDACLKEVVEGYRDSRIHYFHNSPSFGPAKNHWRCFQSAKGEYITVLNHDDSWELCFVEKLVQKLIQDKTLAISFCDHWVIDSSGDRLLEETDRNTKVWGRENLLEGKYEHWENMMSSQSIPMVMGAIFRKDILPEILPEKVGPAYDLWMTYLLNQDNYGVYYSSERLSSYRIHDDNLSGKIAVEWPRGMAECWKAIANDVRFINIHPIARQKATDKFMVCAKNSWILGHPLDCSRFGWQSLQMSLSLKGITATFLLPLLPRQLAKLNKKFVRA